MTFVQNRISTTKSIGIDKTGLIIDHLHEINFLDKTTGEDATNGYGVPTGKITVFRPSSDFFNYVTLKSSDDFIAYAVFTEKDLKQPELFCWMEIEYEDGFEGNNTVAIIGCGDAFKNCQNLIKELEKVTGDEYIFTENIL